MVAVLRTVILLDSRATEGQLSVGRFDIHKGEAPPFHLHTREDEVFLLLKGEALVWVGDERHELSEGGVVYLPRNIPHGYRITSDRADLLLIATPAGIVEMFRHAGRDVTTPRPDGFEITKHKLAEAAALRGNRIIGPPR
ncbi:cupin domain-containing protein [Streptomyces sp. NBC_00885]|uniref:cupin domain-containing protein n=1 Tax=Streptomyces sp. NBC_00885 TaxID=2975857 RepID=UPI00386D11C3|nr:cupin domain-containing protein [Streptomyces sp. NBC_00885]